MKKNIKTVLNILFLVLLIAATLYFTLKDQNIPEIWDAVTLASKRWLLLAIAFVFVYVCSESVIMKYLMHNLSERVSLFSCIKYSFIGFFFSCVTPSASGGQPMQAYYMQKDKHDVTVSALVLMIITVGYKAVLVILSLVMFIFKGPFIMEHLGNVKYILIYGIAANVLFIGFLLIVIFHQKLAQGIINLVIRMLSGLHIVKDRKNVQAKLEGMMAPYHDGAVYIRKHLSTLAIVFVISAIQRVALFLVPWCVYKSYRLSGISAVEIVTLQTIIALSVDMLPLPGGIGAAETSFVVMFENIFGQALLIPGMLLSRGISYYFLVLISGLVTVIAHTKNQFGSSIFRGRKNRD